MTAALAELTAALDTANERSQQLATTNQTEWPGERATIFIDHCETTLLDADTRHVAEQLGAIGRKTGFLLHLRGTGGPGLAFFGGSALLLSMAESDTINHEWTS